MMYSGEKNEFSRKASGHESLSPNTQLKLWQVRPAATVVMGITGLVTEELTAQANIRT